MHWSYCSLALSHRFNNWVETIRWVTEYTNKHMVNDDSRSATHVNIQSGLSTHHNWQNVWSWHNGAVNISLHHMQSRNVWHMSILLVMMNLVQSGHDHMAVKPSLLHNISDLLVTIKIIGTVSFYLIYSVSYIHRKIHVLSPFCITV